ncbi:MAG TPA: ectonucleotide pyrophosphatase/phosphodiesterase [Blastocatellia bacterium]|nr:ectonucleotide pyrophosphatase/phosphodiesterase [Blastocatellia bacterium]
MNNTIPPSCDSISNSSAFRVPVRLRRTSCLDSIAVRRSHLTVVLIALLLFPSAIAHCRSATAKRTLILVSLDGFRWDYLNRGVTPNMGALASTGVKAQSMIPVFPSETFPNHYSIVTGVYPEKHGIVRNSMYDPEFEATFSMSKNAADSRWWGAEPIWVTVEKQGQNSATFFWPGSEAEIEGTRPEYWKKYDRTVADSKRVEEVLAWLDLPAEKRPSFIALYFSDTDQAGHAHGPDSPQVRDAIKSLDHEIGSLVEGLKTRNLLDSTDIIIVSDHGMAATNERQRIFLPDYVSRSLLQDDLSSGGACGLIWPVAGKEAEVYKALLKAPHIKVFRKEEVPSYFHYRNNRRIAPVVLVADEGWEIATERAPGGPGGSMASGRRGLADDLFRTTGEHGYDPRILSMRAIFIAAGPDFRQGTVIEPFENIQLYNLMCRILGLKAAPNDGNTTWSDTVLRPVAAGATASYK